MDGGRAEPENISLGFRTFVDRSAVTFRELTDEEDRRLSAQGRVVRQGRRLCRAGGRSRSGGARRRRDGHRHRPARRSFAGGVPDFAGSRPDGRRTTRRWAAAPPDLSVESRARTLRCASPALSPRSRAPQPPLLTCCASLWHFQPIVPVPIAKCKNRDRQAGVTVSSPFPGEAMVH